MVSLNVFAGIFSALTAIITKDNVPKWMTILMIILASLNGGLVFAYLA